MIEARNEDSLGNEGSCEQDLPVREFGVHSKQSIDFLHVAPNGCELTIELWEFEIFRKVVISWTG